MPVHEQRNVEHGQWNWGKGDANGHFMNTSPLRTRAISPVCQEYSKDKRRKMYREKNRLRVQSWSSRLEGI